MNRKIVASIELGYSTIKILVTEFVGTKQQLLDSHRFYIKDLGEFLTQEPQKLAEKVQTYVNKVNHKLGFEIKRYVVVVPENQLQIIEKTVSLENYSPNFVITKKMQKRFGQEFQNSINPKYHVAHYVNRKYIVDGKTNSKLPIGEQGRYIKQVALLYCIPKSEFDLIDNFLSFIDITVVGYYPKGLAYSVELIDEKTEPSNFDVVVDVNDYDTSINVYDRGYLMNVVQLPVGYMSSVEQICKHFEIDTFSAIGLIDSYVDHEVFIHEKTREFKMQNGKPSQKQKTNEIFWTNSVYLFKEIYSFVSANIKRIKRLYFVGATNDVKGFDIHVNSYFSNLPFPTFVSMPDIAGIKHADMLSCIASNKLAYLYDDEGIYYADMEHTTNEIIVAPQLTKIRALSKREERKAIKIKKKAEKLEAKKKILLAQSPEYNNDQTNQIDWLLNDE